MVAKTIADVVLTEEEKLVLEQIDIGDYRSRDRMIINATSKDITIGRAEKILTKLLALGYLRKEGRSTFERIK